MFSVERFGFTPQKTGDNTADDDQNNSGNKKQMNALLQKSKERLKQKDLELEATKKANLIAEKAAAVKKKAKAMAAAVSTKRKHEPRQLETDEDRKKRKAEAKQAKKDRKAQTRLDTASTPTPSVEMSEAAMSSGVRGKLTEEEHEESADDGQANEEEGSAPTAQIEGFASLLQQLHPNRVKKQEVKIPSQLPNSSPQLEEEGVKEEALHDEDKDAMDTQPNPPEAVDMSNQYSLEDSSTPEVFVPVSVEESVTAWGVDSQLAQTLLEDGISSFFPVQAAVLPLLLQSAQRPFLQPRDICVSAPTGSGKTLSYALPIIQTLQPRVVIRLRALILLPSRELASQVSTKSFSLSELSVCLSDCCFICVCTSQSVVLFFQGVFATYILLCI